MNNTPTHYDIVIVGAGIVGSTLALALAHLPLKIYILEASNLSDYDHKIHDSPISLHPINYQLLQALGIGPSLETATQAIKQVHVSEHTRLGKLRFQATDMGVPALGHVISRQRLTTALQAQLMSLTQTKQSIAQFVVQAPAKLNAFTKTTQGWQISIAKEGTGSLPEQSIQTPLIIAADGHRSQLRQHLNIALKSNIISESALSAWVSISHAHHQVAYERFTQQGVVALLPFTNQTMGVVWTASTPIIESLSHLSDSALLTRLQTVMGYRLGQFSQLSARNYHPIQSFYTNPPAIKDLILLGNAAYSLHPVAAQGLNLSLQDVTQLTAMIEETLHSSTAIPANNRLHGLNLQAYHTIRYPAQRHMQRLTNLIHRSFKPTRGPLAWVRNHGLWILDNCPFLKQPLARRLMGD